jgi:anti-anti-sigma factor
MAIEIAQEQYGAVRILVLSGRLDTETSADLELAVQDLLEANDRHFVVDLGAISYVSSAGLRVLLSLAKQLDGGRGSLRLCGLNASVTQVFDVAGFSKLFVIFPNRAGALAGHPQARLDPMFAKKVASLIGAPESTSAPDRNTSELARSAGQLLDEGKPATAPVKERSTPAPVARAPTQSSGPPGVLGKLRRWFGGKR